MRILISNDDGVTARGLAVLAMAARMFAGPEAEIIVCAPATEQSGTAHKVTLGQLHVHPASLGHLDPEEPTASQVFAVRGTPVDALRVALAPGGLFHALQVGVPALGKIPTPQLVPRSGAHWMQADYEWLPDLVLSGVNHGGNLGHDIHYSGTVAVAIEAAALGVPSVAVSRLTERFELLGKFGVEFATLIAHLLTTWVEDGTLIPGRIIGVAPVLNVNVPSLRLGELKGICLTRHAGYHYDENFFHATEPTSNTVTLLAVRHGVPATVHPGEWLSDQEAVSTGFVAVTPLQVEWTHLSRVSDLAPKAARWRLIPSE